MAEGEVKTEKKTVEMSIWFIILLVVLIIASALVLSLNAKLGDAQKKIETLENDYEALSKKYSTLCETTLELSKQVYDVSPAKLKAELEKAAGTVASEEVVPGDSLSTEVISGEVAQ